MCVASVKRNQPAPRLGEWRNWGAPPSLLAVLNDRGPSLRDVLPAPRPMSARAETAPIGVARQGPLTCPLATFAVAIYKGGFTSTAVHLS